MKIRKSSLFAILVLVAGVFFAIGMLSATWINKQDDSTTTDSSVSSTNAVINSTEVVEDDEEYIPIDIDDVEYIEVSVVDTDEEGIEYTSIIKITNSDIITNIVEDVNDYSLYTDAENEIESGDFLEGSPSLAIHLSDETVLHIVAGTVQDSSDNTINIMTLYTLNDESDKETYECTSSSTLSQDITDAYNKYAK